jgi:hypothetical protein
MKKLINNIMMMAFIATTAIVFTSCEDAKIARTLEGTWRGNMYISSYYGGRSYDATYTEITFLKDPGAYSSGNGYWVDYYSNAPWDYVANHIEWTVDYGVIKVYFVEENAWIRISDYHLNDDRFYGVLDDNGRRVDFELIHTSSPNWGGYRWGYDSWNGYYAPAHRAAAADSTATEKPVRYVRGK